MRDPRDDLRAGPHGGEMGNPRTLVHDAIDAAIRPPLYDSPTTRGLLDTATDVAKQSLAQ